MTFRWRNFKEGNYIIMDLALTKNSNKRFFVEVDL